MERIPKEVIKAYENSESCKKLKELRDRGQEILNGYYKKYWDKEQYFRGETKKKSDHERYATEMVLPRGILCPGNMAALTIGNIKRGKFVKKPVNPGYVYGYDKEDKLIFSDRISGKIRDREYIFWEDSVTQVGLEYCGENLGLEGITETKYDEQGKIIRYLFGSISVFSEEKVDELVLETYVYEGNRAYVTFIDSHIFDDSCDDMFLNIVKDIAEDEFEDEFAVKDYIDGTHIVLYMNDDGLVTKYTRCTDMNPDKVYECVPEHKLVLSGTPLQEADNSGCETNIDNIKKKKSMDILKALRTEVGDRQKLSELVDAFEKMCQIPIDSEEEMILFETGIFAFTGTPLFHVSLVRQFPNGEGEYYQLHLDMMYQPNEKNRAFCSTVWSEDMDAGENFFDFVRKTDDYLSIKDDEILKVDVYMDET